VAPRQQTAWTVGSVVSAKEKGRPMGGPSLGSWEGGAVAL